MLCWHKAVGAGIGALISHRGKKNSRIGLDVCVCASKDVGRHAELQLYLVSCPHDVRENSTISLGSVSTESLRSLHSPYQYKFKVRFHNTESSVSQCCQLRPSRLDLYSNLSRSCQWTWYRHRFNGGTWRKAMVRILTRLTSESNETQNLTLQVFQVELFKYRLRIWSRGWRLCKSHSCRCSHGAYY